MLSKKLFALFFVVCMLSTDFMIPVVLARSHGNHGHGLELLLAAGILAKLLKKKGHHHHHGHHHHGHHHHGRNVEMVHHHPNHGSGTRNVEVVHVAPPMNGYSSYYPAGGPPAYGGAPAATSSFSASIEYPFNPAASQSMPVHHLPYGGPSSAASVIGYEPQPVQYFPPMPMPEAPPAPVHA